MVNAGHDVQVGGVARQQVPPAVQLSQGCREPKFWPQEVCPDGRQVPAEDVVDVPEEEPEEVPEKQGIALQIVGWDMLSCAV